MRRPLRDYQVQQRAEVLEHYERVNRVLLVSPTGSGKGFLASDIVASTEEAGNSCLFVVNRRELVKDMSRRLTRLGIRHGVIMSGHSSNPTCRVQVASKDTLQRRNKPYADLVFIDEAHFAVSDGWKAILEHYKDVWILGMTATPIRLDGRGLGEFFDVIVEGPSVEELQRRGYLVKTTVYGVDPESLPKFTSADKSNGDFKESALALAFNKPKLVGDIVEHWLTRGENRATVVFAVNRAHSESIRDAFLAAGVTAVAVDANTDSDLRDRTWEDLEAGRVKVVCSVGIVSYGWDCPPVKCAILARKTSSLALYLQQVGRVLRPFEGFNDAIVLDHAGNTAEHGFVEDPRQWSLDGVVKNKKGEVEEVEAVRCAKCWLYYSPRMAVCPACGTERPKKDVRPETVAGELKLLERQEPLVLHKQFLADEKYQTLAGICETAVRRGWKPGAPAMMFRARFGQFPKKDWIAAAKAAAEKQVPNG